MESIEKYGIMIPLIVMPTREGVYQIVSGYRRKYCAEKHLDKEIQRWLFEYIRDKGLVKAKQITLLRKACETGIMTEGKLIIRKKI